jgi:methoxymalonate biosynthesis acyl carrier protein
MHKYGPIQRHLIDFLRGNGSIADDVDLDEDLIRRGILESLLVMDLILFMETEYGVHLGPDDITPGNFRTVKRLSLLIRAKRPAPLKKAA